MSGEVFENPYKSLEAEMAALGCALQSPAAVEAVISTLESSDFYRPAHALIFDSIKRVSESGREVDHLTVRVDLNERGYLTEVGGQSYLFDIELQAPAISNAKYYADIVKEMAIMRQLDIATITARKVLSSDQYNSAEERKQAIIDGFMGVQTLESEETFVNIKDAANTIIGVMDKGMESGGVIPGLSYGDPELDDKTGGAQPGDFIDVAASTSMGKTAQMLDWAIHLGKDGHQGCYISLEMSAVRITRRMAAKVSGSPLRWYTGIALSESQYVRAADGLEGVYTLPISIQTSGGNAFTVSRLEGCIRRAKREFGGLAWVAVDFLQLMEGDDHKSQNRAREVSKIAYACKRFAEKYQIAIFALVQLNRQTQGRDDNRPRISDMSESGGIEQAADVVMLLHRPHYYAMRFKGEPALEIEDAVLILGKNRDGECCDIPRKFHTKRVSWMSTAKVAQGGKI